MEHLARSFAHLLFHQHPAQASQGHPEPSRTKASREDVLNYLGQLANDYHLPQNVVYAVADAESSLNPNAMHFNPATHRRGKLMPASWDYGLMQINESRIGGEVKDTHGRLFTIGEDVKTDWKANARAGVAILADGYHLAELEQGPGATEEEHAQQAYSQYNGGTSSGRHPPRDRYLKERRDGLPENKADRHFLQTYQEHWKHK